MLLLFCGCAQKDMHLPIAPGNTILLDDTPFFAQEDYQCGPASLAMVLGASGVEVTPRELVPLTYIPERRGSLQLELISASRRFQRIPFEIEPSPKALVEELRAGRPVLVLQNYGLQSMPAYHYGVVIGAEKNKLILRSGTTRELHMGLRKFLMSWVRPGSWGLVVLKPGEMPVRTSPKLYLKAVSGYEQIGHLHGAELAYLSGLQRWPNNTDILFALGNNRLHQNKPEEAEYSFRKIITLQPDHIGAANNLADVLLDRGCPLQAAFYLKTAEENARRKNSPLLPYILKTKQEVETALTNSSLPCKKQKK